MKNLLYLFTLFFSSFSYARYSNLQEVLRSFVEENDEAYKFHFQEKTEKDNVRIETYILYSQKWPIQEDEDIASTIWKHRLTIYIPKTVSHREAMLYVGGGYIKDKHGNDKFTSSSEGLKYLDIASKNKAIVIALEDVPNQPLFIDSSYKREDEIMAFTFKKVMKDPFKNGYLAGHLPMAKAIIKAMDASQSILAEESIILEKFMLVGASKRGWAVWLAGLQDKRVSALVPVVIDILNVQKNINHICNSYKKHCPPALEDYRAEGIIEHIDSNRFKELMQIEDPYSYLNLPEYAKQFSIPKYIINSSGDDFYAADSSKFYFQNLPGNNYIRFLPQSFHYLAGNPLSNALGNMKLVNEAISNYFYFHLNKISLPEVKWQFIDNKIIVDSSMKPIKATLWSAENKDERDFRCLHSYEKSNFIYKTALVYLNRIFSNSGSICDSPFMAKEINLPCENCSVEIDTPTVEQGYTASFVELTYEIDNRNFIISTEMLVLPE